MKNKSYEVDVEKLYLVKYKQKFYIYDTKAVIWGSMVYGSYRQVALYERDNILYRQETFCIEDDSFIGSSWQVWESTPRKYQGKIIETAELITDFKNLPSDYILVID